MDEFTNEKKPFLTRFFMEVKAHMKVPYRKFNYKEADKEKVCEGFKKEGH